MRTHPLGIFCIGYSLEETFRVATSFSVVTHADPRCIVACCIATGLIRGMLRGEILTEDDVNELIEQAYEWTNTWVKNGRSAGDKPTPGVEKDDADKFEDGELLDRQEFEKHAHASNFGELELDDSMKMGYVYKCLGAAILSLRLAIREAPYDAIETGVRVEGSPSAIFERIITEITFEAGDADTNACAAGALLGCWLGYSALPPHWRDGMRDFNWLMQKCNGLLQTIKISRKKSSTYQGSYDPDTLPDGGKGLMNEKELQQRDAQFMMQMLTREAEGEKEERERLKQEKKRKQRGWKGMFK